MADLYTQPYAQRSSSQYHSLAPSNNVVYGTNSLAQPHSTHSAPAPQPVQSANTNSNNNDGDDDSDGANRSNETSPVDSKPPQKTQSTFLTKLYALLEKPENHHMIRWDPAGDHIIVERPEQLALHVLPSVYRQSRFASFSRQLNIYGFMRKVNLRNVDPAIDDPDASTWSHPTLNRHSPPEVVANFKRRVPPRLPKPRRRPEPDLPQINQSRPPIGMGPVPLTVPSSIGSPGRGRTRGFTMPGAYPVGGNGATGWGYPRSALPPLTVPSDPPSLSHASGMYGSHSAHPGLHSLTPSDESPGSATTQGYSPQTSYTTSNMVGSQYAYGSDSNSWGFSTVNNGSPSNHTGGSLSSLLNPSGNNHHNGHSGSAYTRTSTYASPYSSVPMQGGHHSTSSLSPDSRPTTGYSASSLSSLPYETEGSSISHDYSRPNSSHHTTTGRPMSPTRPHSSHRSPVGGYQSTTSSLGSGLPSGAGSAIRRQRRHSQAVGPYPSPYEQHGHGTHMDHTGEHSLVQRPSSSPQPPTPSMSSNSMSSNDHHHSQHASSQHGASNSSIPGVRSMIQLPAVDSYSYNPSHGDFAYSASGTTYGHLTSVNSPEAAGWSTNGRSVRPSTSTSSLSAISQTSSSQAATPPVEGYGHGAGESDINRFSPDFGYVPLNNDGIGGIVGGVAPPYSKTTELTV